MAEVPEKDRDTTQRGRATGPLGWNTFAEGSSVSGPFASECLGLTPEANSQVYHVTTALPAGFDVQTAVCFWIPVDTCGYLRVHGHGRRGSRSRRAASQSRARSTRSPTASCCSDRRRQRRSQLRAEATPCGSTRPAEPHPTGRQRVCGKAQSRLIDVRLSEGRRRRFA